MTQTRTIIGTIIILIGLSSLFNFPVLKILFAVFIMWFGVRILLGRSGAFGYEAEKPTYEDSIHRVLIFSGIKTGYVSSNFSGGEVVAIFGGGEVDLSRVKTKQGVAELNVVAIFGGLKVKVPRNWEVKSEGVGILGGYTNQVAPPSKKETTLAVKGVAIFGGVDITS